MSAAAPEVAHADVAVSEPPTAAVEAVEAADPGPRTPEPGPVRLVRRPGRLTLRRVDLGSVARMSFAFYLAFVGLLGLIAVLFWIVAAATGLVRRLEHLIQNLFGFTSFHFQPVRIVLWGLVIGATVTVVGTALNLLGALAYNLVAARRGGVRVTFVDEDGSGFTPGQSSGRARPLI